MPALPHLGHDRLVHHLVAAVVHAVLRRDEDEAKSKGKVGRGTELCRQGTALRLSVVQERGRHAATGCCSRRGSQRPTALCSTLRVLTLSGMLTVFFLPLAVPTSSQHAASSLVLPFHAAPTQEPTLSGTLTV